MKKVFVILILLLLVGCNKEEDIIEISYDDTYYQVATPYQEGVGNYSIRDYDRELVEKMLMTLSDEYFKTNNSLYQEGQFLTSEEIKKLLDEYNQTDEIVVAGVKIKPSYITSIYEQNYLATNNVLKGVSLAIIVDNKQYYEENKYKIIDEKVVLDYALQKANSLVKYMRTKEELKNVNIVIGIYLEDDFKGSFKYLGATTSDSIKLKYVNYNYQVLDSNNVMSSDINTYNNILAIKNSLTDFNVYVNAYGLYKDTVLNELTLIINKNYFKRSEILNITNIITKNLNNFDGVNVKVYLKSNGMTKAFSFKVRGETKIETYILEE